MNYSRIGEGDGYSHIRYNQLIPDITNTQVGIEKMC